MVTTQRQTVGPDEAVAELTAAAIAGAAPRVFEPDTLVFLQLRYRAAFILNIPPGEWPKHRGTALQASNSLGAIAAQIAAIHRQFVIGNEEAFAAATIVERECDEMIRGRLCAGLPPFPNP